MSMVEVGLLLHERNRDERDFLRPVFVLPLNSTNKLIPLLLLQLLAIVTVLLFPVLHLLLLLCLLFFISPSGTRHTAS